MVYTSVNFGILCRKKCFSRLYRIVTNASKITHVVYIHD
jgi:hypothetical protein